jgi:hypothetical protein
MCYDVVYCCVLLLCVIWWWFVCVCVCVCVLYTGSPSPPRRTEHRVWGSNQRVRGVQIRG